MIEFGRFAVERRSAKGSRKPETFDFLGFTHICAKQRDGRFILARHTITRRMRMEATGCHSLGLALALHDAGHVVSVVNPAQIRDFARTKLGRNKMVCPGQPRPSIA